MTAACSSICFIVCSPGQPSLSVGNAANSVSPTLKISQAVVTHIFNLSTQEGDAGDPLSLRPALSTE